MEIIARQKAKTASEAVVVCCSTSEQQPEDAVIVTQKLMNSQDIYGKMPCKRNKRFRCRELISIMA